MWQQKFHHRLLLSAFSARKCLCIKTRQKKNPDGRCLQSAFHFGSNVICYYTPSSGPTVSGESGTVLCTSVTSVTNDTFIYVGFKSGTTLYITKSGDDILSRRCYWKPSTIYRVIYRVFNLKVDRNTRSSTVNRIIKA